MKKITLLILAIVLAIAASIAQSPDAFKYQAIVRNSSGEILQNQQVGIQISIL